MHEHVCCVLRQCGFCHVPISLRWLACDFPSVHVLFQVSVLQTSWKLSGVCVCVCVCVGVGVGVGVCVCVCEITHYSTI